MKVRSSPRAKKNVAVVAKYPFYFDDISTELSDLNVHLVSAAEIIEIHELIKNGSNFDYIFFPHYSKLIPADFLNTQNCIGFHTGDLPKDQGGSPLQNKILRGEYLTWVNAIKITQELDSGDILCKEIISLESGSIEEILRNVSKIISRLIRVILIDNPTPVPQLGQNPVSLRIKPEASELKFDELEVKEIYDRIRMLDGLDYPPAYIVIGRYQIFLSEVAIQGNKLKFVSRLEEKR